ncbi:MAG: hypothetical protein D3904_15040, partial [Candidatus Electrothrix sp. EH2]|nr:hypothetical protein [Candidatus Electrothrix sp. EH2]
MTIRIQAAPDKPFYLNNDFWKRYRISTPEKDRLSCPPELKFKPEISGCSFRFFCTFTLQTCFYSGRDRAGEEKASGYHNTKKPNNYLCRDWVSGNPLAKAGAWKRLFRTYWPNKKTAANDLDRLFGPESEDMEAEKKKPRKAELKFHHAVFPLDSTGTALIAPRDEKTGKVSPGPITYEVVNPKRRILQ